MAASYEHNPASNAPSAAEPAAASAGGSPEPQPAPALRAPQSEPAAASAGGSPEPQPAPALRAPQSAPAAASAAGSPEPQPAPAPRAPQSAPAAASAAGSPEPQPASASRAPQSAPSAPAATAYIALGSNMGDREAHLMRAIAELDGQPGIRVTGVSGIYETDPVGYTDQPAFLNMAVAVRTVLEPLELLRTQLRLESLLGRIRQVRWGPRTIDLDLLLYDNVRMDQEELTLPHPRMMERAFVLVPLHDVISSSHPLHEQVATTSARALQAGKDGITLWKTTNWRSASEPSGS